jgi:hypothetical protein
MMHPLLRGLSQALAGAIFPSEPGARFVHPGEDCNMTVTSSTAGVGTLRALLVATFLVGVAGGLVLAIAWDAAFAGHHLVLIEAAAAPAG